MTQIFNSIHIFQQNFQKNVGKSIFFPRASENEEKLEFIKLSISEKTEVNGK
jgi:hypothetical protein